MKQLFLLLLLQFALPELYAQSLLGKGSHSASFYPGSSFSTTEQNDRIVNVSINSGNRTVFVYEYKKADNPNIADDELTEKMFFSIPIPAGKKSFTYHVSDSSYGIYMKACYCTDRGYHKIVGGKISGRKLANGNWTLQLNIIIHTGDERVKPQNRIQKLLFKPASSKP